MTVEDKPYDKKALHDLNNQLGVILGRVQLLQTRLHDKSLITIEEATLRASNLVRELGRFYNARDDGVTLVEESQLGLEEIVYKIVHVDDDSESRFQFGTALTTDSNIIPASPGVFGHNGIKVRYKVHSYGSVEKALIGIPTLEAIYLLVTDREMPECGGYNFLDTISLPYDKKTRKQ